VAQVSQLVAQASQAPALATKPVLQVVQAVALVQDLQLEPQALHVVSRKYPSSQVPQVEVVQALQLVPQEVGAPLSK